MPPHHTTTSMFSYGHNAVGVTRRDAGAARPPVAAAS